VAPPIGGAEKKAAWLLDGDNAELVTGLPEDDPVKRSHALILESIQDLSWLAYRCRGFNRAFGTTLPPSEIMALVPDETLDMLLCLIEHDQIDDPTTLLRLLHKQGSRAG
jgi:hypothetical protein